jgi:hypothetical protein
MSVCCSDEDVWEEKSSVNSEWKGSFIKRAVLSNTDKCHTVSCDILHIYFESPDAIMVQYFSGLIPQFHPRKENYMSKKDKQENEPISQGQKIFDNIWLLFLLSLLISGVIYNAWGLMDLMSVVPAP